MEVRALRGQPEVGVCGAQPRFKRPYQERTVKGSECYLVPVLQCKGASINDVQKIQIF